MLPRIDPTKTKSWNKLKLHYDELKKVNMVDLFNEDESRFNNFSLKHESFLVDFSKNIINASTVDLLIDLAEEVQLSEAIESMYLGENINETENRSVLHVALRNSSGQSGDLSQDIYDDVNSVLGKMQDFSDRIISGDWKGYTAKRITDIVNIGIGGSDLGPAMVYEALQPYGAKEITAHFVSNIDSNHLAETLSRIDPDTTLFIIASKTFTTQETMTNAFSARKWFLQSGKEEDIKKHFVAVSTNLEATREFGIADENVFEFWDWVGGRYSVWSSIGLSLSCSLGFDNFRKFLDGAASMDQHFKEKDLRENIPVILALISIWHINMFKVKSEVILPYNQYLNKLVDYLQQVIMESNGKSVDRNGKKVTYDTCPVIWGNPGTNSQHSFFQMLHQGTQMVPCDFIAAIKSPNPLGDHQEKLLANFFAQSQALMKGKTQEEVLVEMKDQGIDPGEIDKVAPHKVFDGNRPSNTILFDELNPYNLGVLLAMYEHKVFVQGIIWNIYSFDQWGVELGKKIANKILPVISGKEVVSFDGSTDSLLSYYKTKMKD